MTAALLPVLEDLGDIDGASVLVRADFNVPLQSGEIVDDTRIRAGVPTIRWLRNRGASVVVCTHLGRPGGRPDPAWSVEPVRARLSQLVEGISPAPVGTRLSELTEGAGSVAGNASAGARLSRVVEGVELLENLRFDPGEEADDPAFVDRLIEGCDFYVNDAFGVSHRPHASIMGPPRFLPSAAGRLLAREAEVLGGLRNPPRRPFVAVLGGSKVSDKLGAIEALLEVVDTLVVGGAMCFTFLKAMGHEVGASLCEDAMVERCRALLDSGADIRLPEDIVALGPGGRFGDSEEVRCTAPDAAGAALGGGGGHGLRGEVRHTGPDAAGAALGGGGGHGLRGEVRHTGPDLPDGWTGADIGPGSAAAFGDAIASAGTVFWNGPMGVFEDPRFAAGTAAVAAATAETRAFTVVGGGDSAAALSMLGLAGEVDHLSTGGGASLELIEKGDLCGLAALRGAPNAR